MSYPIISQEKTTSGRKQNQWAHQALFISMIYMGQINKDDRLKPLPFTDN